MRISSLRKGESCSAWRKNGNPSTVLKMPVPAFAGGVEFPPGLC
jgi:hypothetical protein